MTKVEWRRGQASAPLWRKRLKAVVLDGKKRIDVHNKAEIKRLSQICNRWVQFQPPICAGPLAAYVGTLMTILPVQMAMDGLIYKMLLKKWGTGAMNQMSVEMGMCP